MSASEVMVTSASNGAATTESQSQTVTAKLTVQNDVEFASCDCCGLTEECTPAYIQNIRDLYLGKWICGLCAEAVNYEMRLMSTEEALFKHISFCEKFKTSIPPRNPAVHLISAMSRIVKRSINSPRSLVSTSSSLRKRFMTRSKSCIPAISLADSDHDQSSGLSSTEEESLE